MAVSMQTRSLIGCATVFAVGLAGLHSCRNRDPVQAQSVEPKPVELPRSEIPNSSAKNQKTVAPQYTFEGQTVVDGYVTVDGTKKRFIEPESPFYQQYLCEPWLRAGGGTGSYNQFLYKNLFHQSGVQNAFAWAGIHGPIRAGLDQIMTLPEQNLRGEGYAYKHPYEFSDPSLICPK